MSAEDSPSCLLRLRLTLSSIWIMLFMNLSVFVFSFLGKFLLLFFRSGPCRHLLLAGRFGLDSDGADEAQQFACDHRHGGVRCLEWIASNFSIISFTVPNLLSRRKRFGTSIQRGGLGVFVDEWVPLSFSQISNSCCERSKTLLAVN